MTRYVEPIRWIVPGPSEVKRYPAQKCEAEGCGKTTHGGKPYCPGHVATHMPYAAAVAALVAPELCGPTYALVCWDCSSEFRSRSKKARRCPQCKRADVARRSAERKQRRAS